MITPWQLPTRAEIGGRTYAIHADYRDILEIFGYLEDPDQPEYLRWQIALALFYEGQIPKAHHRQAMEYLAEFIRCGQPDSGPAGPKLLDWQQDAPAIAAEVNKAAGAEIRAMPFLHWWTFMAYFNAIGQGQLSTIVAIRDKLRRGKALEGWEKEFYRENKARVDLKPHYSQAELQEQARLKALLGE